MCTCAFAFQRSIYITVYYVYDRAVHIGKYNNCQNNHGVERQSLNLYSVCCASRCCAQDGQVVPRESFANFIHGPASESPLESTLARTRILSGNLPRRRGSEPPLPRGKIEVLISLQPPVSKKNHSSIVIERDDRATASANATMTAGPGRNTALLPLLPSSPAN